MLKKVLLLLSYPEVSFSFYNYFESLKEPQTFDKNHLSKLFSTFNITHLSKFLTDIVNVLENVNGYVLIYGSALTDLLDPKTSSLPPNDIDILILSDHKNFAGNLLLDQPKFLDGICYEEKTYFPFKTIKIIGNPTVDINFF